MKTWKWVLISLGITFSILAFFIIVPVVILDQSWWWFFGPFIFFIFVWIVIGIILIILHIKKPEPVLSKVDLSDAKRRVKEEIKNDEDNPDNFKINDSLLLRIGEKGAEKTPVGFFDGKGTERNERRVAIVNLNNPKKETSHLINPSSEEKITEAIRLIADNPPEKEAWEEVLATTDSFGKPIQITRRKQQSSFTSKLEEEKKAADELNRV